MGNILDIDIPNPFEDAEKAVEDAVEDAICNAEKAISPIISGTVEAVGDTAEVVYIGGVLLASGVLFLAIKNI
jgi:hypothetical protein